MQSPVLLRALEAVVAGVLLNPVRFGLEADLAAVRALYATSASRAGAVAAFYSRQPLLFVSNAPPLASPAASFASWTFSQVSPDALSSAGFFFAPTVDRPDRWSARSCRALHSPLTRVERRCLCFACPAVFYNWEEGDDPAQEHRKVLRCTPAHSCN